MASLLNLGGRFALQFYRADRSPQRKRVPLGVRVKRDAEQVRRKLERDYALGTFDPWTDDPLTYDEHDDAPESLGDALAAFLDAKRTRSADTLRSYQNTLGRFVSFTGCDVLVSSVYALHVEAWLDATDAGDVSRVSYARTLRVFFRWAKKQQMTPHVATDDVRLRKPPKNLPRFLSPEEVDRLVAVIRDRSLTASWLAELVVIACHTGLRRGELVNLTWEAVDLVACRLTVRNADDFTTKSGSERVVPLSSAAVAAFKRLERRGRYVFAGPSGKLDASYVTRAFKRYARHAGLPDVYLHHTRHTACSWLAERGVPIEAIRRFAGHSSIAVTMRYAHVSNNLYARAITDALSATQ